MGRGTGPANTGLSWKYQVHRCPGHEYRSLNNNNQAHMVWTCSKCARATTKVWQCHRCGLSICAMCIGHSNKVTGTIVKHSGR